MKEIDALKKGIKTFSFFFVFIVFLYPIKALFAFMEEDITYLGLLTDGSQKVFLWIKFLIKFLANIIFFIGLFNLTKVLNFESIKDIFSSKNILLFKKTSQYFLRSVSVGSLVIIIEIFDGKFASLKSNNDFLFTLYFALIIGFFFLIFSKILKTAKELKQENDLTI